MVYALKGKEHVEWANPYNVGITGLIGFTSGYHAINDCDALLMLGTDFPYRQFYPQGTAQIAQVDLRPEQLGRRVPINLGLVGDVGSTIDSLLPLLNEKLERHHLDRAVEHYRKALKDFDELASWKPGDELIHPQQVAKALSDQATEDAVFACDVGPPDILRCWQAAPHRLVLAWPDGKRDGTCHWRANDVQRAPGDLAVG
jgi:pyruvate dehydrogenase (quinone)